MRVTSIFVFVLFFSAQFVMGQTREAALSWASIDSRATPAWWSKAKFGIFVFWNPSAVPAFAPRGEYAEWYWYWIRNPDARGSDSLDFHRRAYGESFEYADFVPLFKGELFDPDEWAELIERSGAKYVVFNAKHHDGYTMWPSKEANESWGRRWNSLESGPHRDIVGEVAEAVRKRNLRFGVYYSLYEWFNPLYVADPHLFVEKVYFPQFRDLVTRYRPQIIFADGEWEHGNEVWRSEKLLAWLFNESPVRDQVVVNDRWFKGSRHRHGGYYTTEYGSGLDDAIHPWEENRAIGKSYGYNRAELAGDYSTTQELVLMLVDIVSRGGNFLLDVGPAADGKIPPIMEDRLIGMGDWLKVNGESIYGTKTWKRSCQWSDGEIVEAQRGEFRTGYDILRLTLKPGHGQAVKEIFFTQNGSTLYAIVPRLRKGPLVIRDVLTGNDSKVSLLGFDGSLSWEKRGNDIVIQTERVRPLLLPSDLAVVFRITSIDR